ncbi:PIN domain-containing protein [Microlunatus sp. Y2014]|uniref:PIN domain-containing protein n=1 Tax=Microlunatus sp. Y2014 TaxID=3418488 RepID=UPI003DA730C7
MTSALIDNSEVGDWCRTSLASGNVVAPHLMPFEVANIIRRSVLRGAISAADGAAAISDLGHLTVEYVSFDLLSESVWRLRDNFTAYDASYVAAAAALACPLITLDRRLSRAPDIPCQVVTPW